MRFMPASMKYLHFKVTRISVIRAFTLLLFSAIIAGCGGGGINSTPLAGASLSSPRLGSALCATTGGSISAPASGSSIGIGIVTTTAIGGCSISINFGQFLTPVQGTYIVTAYLPSDTTVVPTLQPIPATVRVPTGFTVAAFKPVLYAVVQMINFSGLYTNNDPAITYTANSLSVGTTPNFYDFYWRQKGPDLEVSPSQAVPQNFSNDNLGNFPLVPFTISGTNQLTSPFAACMEPLPQFCEGHEHPG
jgi:hypothetical protein